ncbi:TPA: hypothetical protein N0F65_006869 [Lagenidium giganteum]|uniref:Mannosyltransferase n=1 Tax=Lagenidium giganteum TaxID=4803 RepID=A0AAV2ZDV0_9STRA|nr:TPA: hypothetical protein N0F65_006869 [Lagenidium giganteum]
MAKLALPSAVDLLLVAVVSFHIFHSPYAKVEESFNLQATHDLLLHGVRNVSKFDHIEFPGVVPRTFLGSLVVALLLSPIAWGLQLAGAPKFYLQYATRWVLGMLGVAALLMLKRRIVTHFDKDAANFFVLINACQFHIIFYLGRTLPNVYALVLVVIAVAYWIEGKWKYTIYLFTFTTIVFRGDTAVLFAPILLSMLFSGRISIVQIILYGLTASVVSLALTVLIDSYFWQRWLWPEGEVLWFNTVLNKSHEWGVMPPFWYFYSALPRALLATAVLVPFGISSLLPAIVRSRSLKDIKTAFSLAPVFDMTVWTFFWPVGVYLSLFSILPHKELRFIFNSVPLINLAAAVGAAKLYRDRAKSLLPFLGVIACLFATIAGSVVFTIASHANYPGLSARPHIIICSHYLGGVAFARLHQLAASEQHLERSVHIDVPSAMTGVSRFGEEFGTWKYSKDESVLTEAELAVYDYLLTTKDPSTLQTHFELVESFATFQRVKLSQSFPPMTIETQPYIYILRNKQARVAA